MAYLSMIDFFKDSTDNPADEFTYTVTGSDGSFDINRPITNGMTRNLGTKARFIPNVLSHPFVLVISVNSAESSTTFDTEKFIDCMALLGHNLETDDTIRFTTSYVGGSTSTQQHTVVGRTDKFNSDFFYVRKHGFVPTDIKVEIVKVSGDLFIDFGRLWAGNTWDLGDPVNDGTSNIMDQGFKIGMVKGAKSIRSRGAQSYSNHETPLKSLKATIRTIDESELIGEFTKTMSGTNSFLNLINKLENGDEVIFIPREFTELTTKNWLWSQRFGIYGESSAASHTIDQDSSIQFSLNLNLIELL